MGKITGTVFALCILLEGWAAAATINVTTAQGSGCTVENAIATLNAGRGVGGCTIQGFGAVTISVPNGTFFVQGVNVNIQRSVTLTGASMSGTVVQFSNLGGQFDSGLIVNGGLSVTVKNLTLRGATGSRLLGLFNSGGNMTMTSVRLTGFGGGGMSQFGIASLDTCTIDHNGTTASFLGGGINFQGDLLTINRTNLTNNTATLGGGIFSASSNSGTTLTITNSLISQNTATDQGGGIYCENQMELDSSTINANVAQNRGGGIRFDAPGDEIHLQYLTVASNSVTSTAGTGAGVSVGSFATPIVIGNIFARNFINNPTHPNDLEWPGTSQLGSNCLIQNTSGWDFHLFPTSANNKIGVDPQLQALQNQGGPTSVRPITTASPAFNAIPLGTVGFNTDQRGLPRPARNAYDMGAYELQ
jgi:predicted outer membrane repeat protein